MRESKMCMNVKAITKRIAAAAACRTHQMDGGERTEVPLLNKGDAILNAERRHGAAACLRHACQLHVCTHAPNHASASYYKGLSLSLRSGSQDTDPRFKVCPTRPSSVFALRPGFQRYLQLISLDLLTRFIIEELLTSPCSMSHRVYMHTHHAQCHCPSCFVADGMVTQAAG